jgi:hypothetical protein
MLFWHLRGIPPAFAWALLSPCLAKCLAENPRIKLPIFPALTIANIPTAISKNNAIGYDNYLQPHDPALSPMLCPQPKVGGCAALLPAHVLRSSDIVFAAPSKSVPYNSLCQTQTMSGALKFGAVSVRRQGQLRAGQGPRRRHLRQPLDANAQRHHLHRDHQRRPGRHALQHDAHQHACRYRPGCLPVWLKSGSELHLDRRPSSCAVMLSCTASSTAGFSSSSNTRTTSSSNAQAG